jgi:hypothetical protein
MKEKYFNPSDLIPVPRIYDKDVINIFYSPSMNQFFTKYKRINKLFRPINWDKITVNYTAKNKNVRVYSYRYVNIPYSDPTAKGNTYLRVKEEDWGEMYKTLQPENVV